MLFGSQGPDPHALVLLARATPLGFVCPHTNYRHKTRMPPSGLDSKQKPHPGRYHNAGVARVRGMVD
ncbi:hypothetical protein RSAG8_06715, partial [Rhizoctonia solani AG-8 WAC10335]